MRYLIIISLFLFQGQKKYQTSYETLGDFKSPSGVQWYIEAGPAYDALMDSSFEVVQHGILSHKHWIPTGGKGSNNNEDPYDPFRAYQTIQFDKSSLLYMTKVLVSFYAWTDDWNLQNRAGIDDWFSFLTVSCDSSDNWARTILANLTTDGYIRLVHVPNQGEQTHIFQIDSVNNPTKSRKWKHQRWNRIDMYVDPDSVSGKAVLWQNQFKMSEANVRQCQFSTGMTPFIVQIHAGLYASEANTSGLVYNDKLRVIEVTSQAQADSLVNEPW